MNPKLHFSIWLLQIFVVEGKSIKPSQIPRADQEKMCLTYLPVKNEHKEALRKSGLKFIKMRTENWEDQRLLYEFLTSEIPLKVLVRDSRESLVAVKKENLRELKKFNKTGKLEDFTHKFRSVNQNFQSKKLLDDNNIFHSFPRYEQVVQYLQSLPKANSNVKVEVAGRSVENRSIYAVKFIYGDPKDYPVIFIEAAAHAREWIALTNALYIVKSLAENTEPLENIAKFNWVILPLVNPDGYEYSHTNFRLWRKNRRVKGCDYINCLCGVDINRNYPFTFKHFSQPCEDDYEGPSAASEPETRAVISEAYKHASHIKLYLSFHSFGGYILHSWGYTAEKTEDYKDLKALGMVGRDAIKKVNNHNYIVGGAGAELGTAPGGSDDFGRGQLNIKYSYTIEAHSDKEGWDGFIASNDDIIPIGKEIFAGVRAMASALHFESKRDTNTYKSIKIRAPLYSTVTHNNIAKNYGSTKINIFCIFLISLEMMFPI